MASGEEVTGLHAFDELDPVSTVSALNVMPDEEPALLRPAQPRAPLPPAPRSGALPSRSSPPPPPRSTLPPAPHASRPPAARSSLPPRPSSARPPAQLGRSLPPLGLGRPSPLPAIGAARPGGLAPPPPRGGLGGASVPPPPKRTQASEQLGELDADTRVVPNAFENDPDYSPTATQGLRPVAGPGSYDAFDDSDADHTSVRVDPSLEGATQQIVPVAIAVAATRRAPAIDDTALLELSATTVATDIDMDWDEEEVATKLRDESAVPARVLNAAPAPGALGNPSPFGARTTLPPGAGNGMFGVRPGARSSFPPPVPVHAQAQLPADWEDEDEAMTQVREPSDLLQPAGAVATTWSGFPAPNAARASTVELDAPSFDEPANNRWPWAVLAAAAVIGASIAANSMMQDEPGTATVTLVTKPGDSEVAIDGRALVGQTSPFMVQDIAPGVDHEVVVRKEGFEPQTRRFRVGAGQVMPLDGIELAKLDAGTGFALATMPAGAKVFVDGAPQEGVTPLRVTDLMPGLHVIRVEHPDGHKPWESQVALARGQVIDLPAADLTSTAPPKKAERGEAEPTRPKLASAGSGKRSKGSARRAAVRAARAGRASASAASRPARMAAPARMVAAAPSASGADGALRVNSRPWSQVFVDGRLVGNTPLLNVPLRAGKHKVRLVNPELGMSKQLTVQIDKGKATTKVVELQ